MSFVGMGHYVCPVTGKEHGQHVLIDNSMRKDRFPDHGGSVQIGISLSPEAQNDIGDGIYLVAAKKTKDGKEIKLEGAVLGIARKAFTRLFDIPIPKEGFVFCDKGVIDNLKKGYEKNTGEKLPEGKVNSNPEQSEEP